MFEFYKLVYLARARGIRDTVVARWPGGQQVERLILHQGHDLKQD